MVYAGYIWMIARGDEAKVEKAKDTIVNCIIGVVIVVGAYAITSFIITQFNKGGAAATGANQWRYRLVVHSRWQRMLEKFKKMFSVISLTIQTHPELVVHKKV